MMEKGRRITQPMRVCPERKVARAGFGVAPILYMLGLIGVGAGVLFSSYSQSIKNNVNLTNSFAVKSDLDASATTIAATSVLGTTDNTYLCPPQGGNASTNCTNAPQKIYDFYPALDASLSGTDPHLPNSYASASSGGTPVEVGVFSPGAGMKQFDPWGHYYVICRWENQSQSSDPAFQIISAGPSGKLQTKCGDATAGGDNQIIAMNAINAINRAAVWQEGTLSNGSSGVYYGTTGAQLGVDNNGNLIVPGTIAAGSNYSSATGNITLTSGSISAAAVTLSGNISATNGTFTGSLSAENAAFQVGASGNVSTTGNGSFTGSLTAGNSNFTIDSSGNLTVGTSGSPVFTVAAATGAVAIGSTVTTLGAVNVATTTPASGIAAPYLSVGTVIPGTPPTYLFYVDQYGSVHVTNSVNAGSINATTTSAGALTASSIVDSGSLSAGASTLGATTVASLIVSGSATINGALYANGGIVGTATIGGGGGLTLSGVVPIANGGTNASDITTALANLGVTGSASGIGYLNLNLLKSNYIPGADIVSGSVTASQLDTPLTVAAGTYTNATITVGLDGRVTFASNGSATSPAIDDGAGDSVTAGTTGILFDVGSVQQGIWTTTGLGIGTTSPGAKLDVNGNIRIEMAAGTTTPNQLQLMNGATSERWAVTTDGSTETGGSGGTGGSNYTLLAYDNSGVVLTTAALSLTRTGNATFAGTVSAANFSGSGAGLTGIGTASITGVIGTGNGGTGTSTTFTQGSVVFAGASGVYTQDNAKFFWDDTHYRLGIGTATPNSALQAYSGEVQVGSSGVGCSGTNGGAVRYDSGILYYCNGGAWTSLIASGATITGGVILGAAAGAANPYATGDVTTGLYSAGTGKVNVSSQSTQVAEFSATGINIATGGLYLGGVGGILYPANDADGFGSSIAIGPGALSAQFGQSTQVYHNTAIGSSTLTSNTTGNYNTAVGWAVLLGNTAGADNTAFGASAMQSNNSGSGNTAVGMQALCGVTGDGNVAVGSNAGCSQSTDTGQYNVSIGFEAFGYAGGYGITGSGNIAIGDQPLGYISTGSNNIAIGGAALTALETGNSNTVVGDSAAGSLNNGNQNTVLGNAVGPTNLVSGNNNILIGTDASVDLPSDISNWLNIGNVIFGKNLYNATNTSGVPQIGLGKNLTTVTAGAILDLSSNSSSANSSMILPVGTGAARPSGVAGMLRYNSDTPAVEAYVTGSGWVSLLNSSSTLGGGIVLGTSETTANPYATGDITTGFYSAGTGKVDVTSQGTGIAEFNGTGLGIGVSPTYPLVTSAAGSNTGGVETTVLSVNTIGTTGSGTRILFHQGLDEAAITGWDSNNWGGALSFATANSTGSNPGGTLSERMRITDTGSVGIGTAVPENWSSISGANGVNAQIYSASNQARFILNSAASSPEIHMIAGAEAANHRNYRLYVDSGVITLDQPSDNYSSTQHLMTWTNGGLVSIGTTVPLSTLSVSGGVAIGTTYASTNAAASNNLIVQGSVGVGTTTPGATFTVGNNAFEVNSGGTVLAGLWNGTVIGTTYGGTGQSTYATGDILYASGANTLSKLAAGTNGYVLTLASGVPSWAAAGGVTSFSGGTTGFTPSSATTGAITLAGTLNVSNGGTGLTTVAAHAVVLGEGTSPLGTAGPGNANSLFVGAGASSDPFFTTTPTVANYLTVLGTSPFGTSSVNGIVLQNTGTATSSVPQYSPRVHFTGQGWKTNSTAASQSVDFIEELQPTVVGSTAATGNLVWSEAVNGGSYSPVMTLPTSATLGIGTTTPVNTLDVTGSGIHLASGVPGSTTESLYNSSGSLYWNGNPVATGGAGGSISGTTNYIPYFTSSSSIGNSVIYQSGSNIGIGTTTPASALQVIGDIDITNNAILSEVANAGSTGTTIHKLAKLSSGSAVIASISDTDNIIGVVVGGAGTTGNAQIAVDGQATCVFDNATTAGDYVTISSGTAGDCHDAGASRPSSGQNIGRVLSTHGSGGTYAIMMGLSPAIAVASLSGSGTADYTARWTPDGVTLGTGALYDNGTSVGVGTNSPGATFTVGNNAFEVNSSGTVLAGLWNGTAIGTTYGGTGQTSYSTGDILYASGANTLSKLAAGTNGYVLTLASGVPSWVASVSSFSAGTTGFSPSSATTGAIVLGGTLVISHGGTGQTTAAGARGSAGLDIDEMTLHGDSSYTIIATDRTVATSASLTSTRTWTLPSVSAMNAGQQLCVVDDAGGVTSTNTLTLARAGSDTINGATSYLLNATYQGVCLVADTTNNKWSVVSTYSATAVNGSGTNNYVARWTPNGSTLGIGILYDDGTSVGVGTNSPGATFTVGNNAFEINTSGTVLAGLWNGTAIGTTYGGTGQTSYSTGDILYASGANTLSKLAAGTNGYVLTLASGVPTWAAAAAGGVTTFSAGTTGFTPSSATTGAITLAGTLNIANGGTGQTTVAGARASSGLDIDEMTFHGNSSYTIVTTDRTVATNASLTSARTWTLPAASGMNDGQQLCVVDDAGGVTSTNTLTISRAGSDTIDGATSYVLGSAYQGVCLVADATNGKWSITSTFSTSNVTGSGTNNYVVRWTPNGTTLGTGTLYDNGTSVGVGTNSPGATFTVGNNAFEVNSSGTVLAGLWNGTAVGTTYGGTGQTSYSTGDLLYASGANTLSKLPASTDGYVLTLASGVPTWSAGAASGVSSFSAGTTGFTPSSATTGAITLAGTLNIANGGTGQTTAAGARGSSGLNIDEMTFHGDSTYTILTTDRTVATNASLTTTRTWTLPAASAMNNGQQLCVVDDAGGVTSSNTLTIARAGSDTIDGATGYVFGSAYQGVCLVADATNGKWSVTSTFSTSNVTGSGTNNYVARWTPNGATLGIGALYDNGTSVGVGTNSPGATFTVGNNAFEVNSSGTVLAGTWNGTAIGTTYGGTGQTTYATGDILYASGANTLSKLTAGTNGYVLTLASGVPTWAASSGGGTSFSAGTTGFTPSSTTTGAITLAGTLVVANGGTGDTTLTAHSLMLGEGTSPVGTAGPGATYTVLIGNGASSDPSFTGAPTISGALTTLQNIGSTSTDGIVLQNTTAATSSVQQYSPRLHFTGQGWKTNATAASQSVDFVQELKTTVTGTSGATGSLVWSESVNAGLYLPVMSLSSAGGLSVGSNYAGTVAPADSILVSGYLGVGTNNPGATFTVGSNAFEVNSSGTVLAGLWNGTAIGTTYGGTGQTSYSTGDILYASGANTLSKLAAGTNGYILTLASGVPTWAAAPASGVTTFSAGTTGFTPSSATTGAITLAGTLNIANGGTGQTTAAGARGSSGLNIDEMTFHGDSSYTILVTDRAVATNASLTSARTWTLPAASAMNGGQQLCVVDDAGGVTSSNTLTIARAGTDTINGATSYALSGAYQGVCLLADATNGKWSVISTYYSSSAVSGSGTNNYVARWTPNGATLGIGTLYDNGTSVGVGTNSPGATFTVGNNAFEVNSSGTVLAGLWNGTAIGTTYGGTGQTTYATGDILYASGANTLSKLTAGTNGYVLTLASGVPSWAAVVTSFSGGTTGFTPSSTTTGAITLAGTLNVANGGTGATTLTAHSVVLGEGTSPVGTAAPGTNTMLYSSSSSADPIFTTSPTLANYLTVLGTAGIGSSSIDGIVLQNTSAATVGTAQFSPRVHFKGQGWKTNATAGTQALDFIEELQPLVTGTSAVTGNLVWSDAINGGSYNALMTLTSAGNIGLGTTTPTGWSSLTNANGVNMQIYSSSNQARFILNSASSSPELHMVAGGESANDRNYRLYVNSGVITLDQPSDDYSSTQQLMTWTKTGLVGIGTIAPLSTLSVAGGVAIGTTYANTNAASSSNLIVQGSTGLSTASPLSTLSVAGGVAIGTTYAAGSAASASNLIVQGSTGIATASPLSALSVAGGVAIGTNYAGTNAASLNNLIVQGNVGVGSTTPATTLTVAGPISLQQPAAAITASTYTVVAADSSLIFAPSGTITVTLPAASSFPGRILNMSNTAAFTVVSASSNVIPQIGGSAATAILPATAGAYAQLQSNGTSWVIMMSGGGASGSSSLSGLTVATATNTIDNVGYAQSWTWNSLAGATAMNFSSTSTLAASNAQKLLSLGLSGANGTSTQTTYDAYFTNTHTGTASTNVALYASASLGTSNYAAVFAAGNVGIGTTTPAQLLEVNGIAKVNTGLITPLIYPASNGTSAIQITKADGTTNVLDIDTTNGRVGIGSATPSYLLDVAGASRFTGGYTTSDRRWKTNIEPLTNALSTIEKLQGVGFDWRRSEFPQMHFSDQHQLGFIAQEVEKVLPNIVSTDSKGYKSVSYESVIPVLTQAVKELKADNDNLRSANENQSKAVDELRKEFEEYKKAHP